MHDPALRLFVDDVHIRNVFAMRRQFFTPIKQELPAFVDGEILGQAIDDRGTASGRSNS